MESRRRKPDYVREAEKGECKESFFDMIGKDRRNEAARVREKLTKELQEHVEQGGTMGTIKGRKVTDPENEKDTTFLTFGTWWDEEKERVKAERSSDYSKHLSKIQAKEN